MKLFELERENYSSSLVCNTHGNDCSNIVQREREKWRSNYSVDPSVRQRDEGDRANVRVRRVSSLVCDYYITLLPLLPQGEK